MEIIESACDNNTEIFGYNTDAVYCERPKEDKFTSDMVVKVFQKIGETPSLIEKKNYQKDINISKYTL